MERRETSYPMPLVFRLLILLLSSLCMCSSANAQDQKPEIFWLKIDWQPAWINSGPQQGQGHAQVLTRMLQERLPQYKHRDQLTNAVRIYKTLKNRESCFPLSTYQGAELNAEKRLGLIWSAPTFIFLYHGLIARPEAIKRIKQYEHNGAVDFTRLIADTSIIGAYQPGRSYSRYLNKILTDDPNAKNLFPWAGATKMTQGMFNMLDAKRLDYFIDYFLTLKYHELSSTHADNHHFFPLLEHKNRYGFGAVACNDTPQGRKLITEINIALEEIRRNPDYIATHLRWHAPNGQKLHYKRLWADELLTRIK